MTKPPIDANGRYYDVLWSEWHHGQYTPDRPWCLVVRSKPGTPGEPYNGIRYMKSYETRERAIVECAKERAHFSRKVKTARAKLEALTAEAEAAWIVELSAQETPRV